MTDQFPDLPEEEPAPEPEPESDGLEYSVEELENAKHELEALKPTDYIAMQRYMERLEISVDRNFPEAGGVAWVNMRGRTGAQINLTARAVTPAAAIDLLVEGIQHASSVYRMSADPQYGREPAPQPVHSMPQEPSGPQYVPDELAAPPSITPVIPASFQTPSTSGAVADKSGHFPGTREIFVCVAIVVTPQANGKSKVDFYGNDRNQPKNKYPNLYVYATPEQFVGMFSQVAQWKVEHFTKAGEYPFQARVTYQYSDKLNQVGTYYKNVVSVVPV